ncbi:hypothetical protein RJ641_012788, partial [Dillenia turbinata]
QVLAIRSWLALSPNVNVVLFPQDPSVYSLSTQFVLAFLLNLALISRKQRAQASESNVSILIDPGSILLPDFLSILIYAYELNRVWLPFTSLRNISHSSYRLDESGEQWRKEDGKRISVKKSFLVRVGNRMSLVEGRCLWYGTKEIGHYMLEFFVPFCIEKRFVFDATWAIANIYPNILNGDLSLEVEGAKWPYTRKRIWENVGNHHLTSLNGSSDLHEANFSNIVKLLWISRLIEVVERILYCMNDVKSREGIIDCSLEDSLKPSELLDLPFSLETLLPIMAGENKKVVFAVSGYNYKDMLMSWACGLKRLVSLTMSTVYGRACLFLETTWLQAITASTTATSGQHAFR